MIRKQIKSLIAAGVILLIALIAFLVSPWNGVDDRAVTEDTPETLPGEEIGASNRFYMYSSLNRSEMSSIEVVNGYGSFKVTANEDGTFYVDGYEGIALDDKLVSSLVTTCGSPLSKMRVVDNATDEKLEEYGLKEPIAHWTVTDKGGKQYKVYVGRALLTGGGYYCRFAGRNSVYVLDSSLADTVLCPVEDFVTPYIMFGVSQNDYYTVDNFTVYHKDEKVISIGRVPEEDMVNPDSIAENIVTYPAPYTPDSQLFSGLLLGYGAFTGDSTYKLGPDVDDLKECGLDDPDYTVAFDYRGQKLYFLLSDDGDGGYYAISGIYSGIISKIAKRNIRYVGFDLLDWISPYVFRRSIKTISTITVKTAKVDETFYLSSFKDADGQDSIQVRGDSGYFAKGYGDTQNFRNFYGDLLEIAVQDYLPAEASEGVPMEDFVKDEGNLTMSLKIVTNGGEELNYEFYRYSTRRCAVSVNGRLDFCGLSDDIIKTENDCIALINGENVEPHY